MRGIGLGFATEARDISLAKVSRLNLEPTQTPLFSRLKNAGLSLRPDIYIWRRGWGEYNYTSDSHMPTSTKYQNYNYSLYYITEILQFTDICMDATLRLYTLLAAM
jgi:hypothetical protein